MRTRIYNARILTMEDGAEIFRGEIQIEDGKISSVMSCDDNNGTGRKHDVIWDEEIDACGNLIMPGFKNAHTHSPMTFLRSYADDMKLQEWLYDKVFPAEAELTEEDIYWLTKLAIMEYLTSGITSSFDMYKLKHETARASEETGFRMVLCGDINDFGGTAQDVENDYLKYNKDKDSLISYQMGFHAEYTTSRELKVLQKPRTDIRRRYASTAPRRRKRWRSAGNAPVCHLWHIWIPWGFSVMEGCCSTECIWMILISIL